MYAADLCNATEAAIVMCARQPGSKIVAILKLCRVIDVMLPEFEVYRIIQVSFHGVLTFYLHSKKG